MNQLAKILLMGGLCTGTWCITAFGSTNLETSSSLAGITVAMNNYYASNEEPEKALSEALESIELPQASSAGGSTQGGSEKTAESGGSAETKSTSSA